MIPKRDFSLRATGSMSKRDEKVRHNWTIGELEKYWSDSPDNRDDFLNYAWIAES